MLTFEVKMGSKISFWTLLALKKVAEPPNLVEMSQLVVVSFPQKDFGLKWSWGEIEQPKGRIFG